MSKCPKCKVEMIPNELIHMTERNGERIETGRTIEGHTCPKCGRFVKRKSKYI